MSFGRRIVSFSVENPRLITLVMIASTLVVAAAAILPTVLPAGFSFLNPTVIDTDPENMLSKDEAVRVHHNLMKKEMSLNDIVVVGVVNERHPDGVFNVETHKKAKSEVVVVRVLFADGRGFIYEAQYPL